MEIIALTNTVNTALPLQMETLKLNCYITCPKSKCQNKLELHGKVCGKISKILKHGDADA